METKRLQELAGIKLNENIELIKKLADKYIGFKKLVNKPDYHGQRIHYKIELDRIENKIRQMSKKEEFKQEFEKLIPDFKF